MHNVQKHTILLIAILLWLCVSVFANEVTVAFVNGAPQGILWHNKDNWTMLPYAYRLSSEAIRLGSYQSNLYSIWQNMMAKRILLRKPLRL